MAKIEFGGKIGDDWRTSEPWWPPLPTPPDGAPNVVLIVLDDVGFAQLGCYGSDIDTPVIDGLAADGFRLANFHTTALCSPTRACLLTGRNHHRSGMGRVADLAERVPRLLGPAPTRERLPLRDPPGQRVRHLRRGQVAPEPRGRDQHGELADDVAPRARLRPLVRVPRRGDPPVRPRPSTTTTTAVRPADPSRRGTTSAPTWPIGPSSSSVTCAPSTPSCRSSSISPRAPAIRPTMRRRNGSSATRGASPRGGTAGARRPSPASSPSASSPRATELSPRPPWVPAWDSLDERERTLGGAVHGVLRRLPLLHGPADRAGARLHRRPRRRGRHGGHPRVGQRRQLRRRQGGHDQRGPTVELRGRGRRRDVPTDRRDRRPPQPQQLPLGMDHGGEHAVQALEARGARGRRRRPLHRPGPHVEANRRGWGPPAVRPRRRHPAHRARAGRHRPAARDRRDRPVAPRRHQLRLRARRGRCGRARPAPHPALRDARLAGDLPRRVEGGDLPPGRADLRRRAPGQRPLRRRRLGALPRGRGRVRGPRPAPPSSRRRWRSSWRCGGRRRGATTCSRSTTGCSR